MMNALRNHASGWVVKILLGLLIVSFAAWGIGDIFTTSGRDMTLAKVGDIKISRSEFDAEYRRKIAEIKSMMGTSFNEDIIKGINLDAQILSSLVDQYALVKEAESLGIVISDNEILDAISKDKNFQGNSGKFDLRVFEQVLNNNHISEHRYYDMLKMQMKAELILKTLSGQKLYSPALVEKIVEHALEKRDLEVILIPTSTAIKVGEPNAEELISYYERNKQLFTAPELREGKLIDIRYNDVAKTIAVSPEDIASTYKERIESYKLPETRELDQLLFADEKSAKAAHALLLNKTTFDTVAKQSTLENAGKTHMGFVAKRDLPAAASETVFALKTGEFTSPIQTDFGWNIFSLKAIKSEGFATLEQATPAIEKELQQKRAEEELYATVNKLEDALAAGSTLETAAKDVGLSVNIIPPITKEGMDAIGNKVNDIPSYKNLVSALFDTDEKNQSAMTMAEDGSYFVIETTKITPERIKPIEEVKSELIAAWKIEKKSTLLQEKASQIAKEIGAGKTSSEALKASGIAASTKHISSVTRGDKSSSELSSTLLQEAFSLPEGKTTSAIADGKGGYAIALIKKIIPANQKEIESAESIRTESENQLAKDYDNELYEQYMRYLRTKYNAEIFTNRLPKATATADLNEQ